METINFKETPGGFKFTIINTDTPKSLNTETKHTKGEWIISDKIEQGIFRYTSIKCEDIEICSVKRTWTEEGKANANLILSAPDLLEALSLLYESLPDGYTSECLPFVRKAIKKATAISF